MKYTEVVIDIREKIINGTYIEGDQLPVEEALCKNYSCSKITIKKAFQILSDEGLIVRQRGAGTFIKLNALKTCKIQQEQFLGFTRSNEPQNSKTIVEYLEFDNPNDNESKSLAVDNSDLVYRFKRMRERSNVIVSVEYSTVPVNKVKGLTKEILENSFFEFIEKSTKLKITSIHKDISVVKSPKEVADAFEMKEGELVALLDETHYLSNGDIFEHALIYLRCEHLNITTIFLNKC